MYYVFLIIPVPGVPHTTHDVNSTAISVTVTLIVTRFFLSRYCVTFIILSRSGQTLTRRATELCSRNNTFVLAPVEEDTTYEYYAAVNNTAGIRGPGSMTAMVTTATACKSPGMRSTTCCYSITFENSLNLECLFYSALVASFDHVTVLA